MSLRITNNMILARNLRNQNANLYRMNQISEDIDSTVSLHRPSDDPVKVSRVLRIESDLSLNIQYQENIGMVKSWLSVTDSSMDEMNKVLQRARELAVQGASGTFGKEDKQKMEQELNQLRDHIITSANQTFTGRRIYTGFRTDKDLLKSDGSYNTAEIEMEALPKQEIEMKIGDQQSIALNITGDKVFRPVGNDYTKPPKIIEDLDLLMRRLHEGDSEGVSESIKDMDDNLKNLLEVRGEVGAKLKTIEVIEDRMSDDNLNLKKLLSETRDTKMAEAYTNLMSSEAVYRASLAVAARIIQPTLVDFLR